MIGPTQGKKKEIYFKINVLFLSMYAGGGGGHKSSTLGRGRGGGGSTKFLGINRGFDRCTRLKCLRLDCPPACKLPIRIIPTHVKALHAGKSGQGTSEPITPPPPPLHR